MGETERLGELEFPSVDSLLTYLQLPGLGPGTQYNSHTLMAVIDS